MTHKTHHDLPETTRQAMIALLNQQLADGFDLFSQIKQAHWNVKGMQFISLHELFDDIAENVLEATDMIAERVTALGGTAMGTVRMSAHQSRLPEFANDPFKGEAYVAQVASRVGAYAQTTRQAIDTATDAGDAGTADLFTEVVRDLDKHLYFLDAHLN